MNLESQLTSLEYSKKLAELCLEQSSMFYWFKPKNSQKAEFDLIYLDMWEDFEKTENDYEYYSAFNVAELGEKFPNGVGTIKHDNKWRSCHYTDQFYFPLKIFNSEADKRADMIIHMITSNRVTDEWRKQWIKK